MLEVGNLEKVIDTLEMRDFEWFNRKRSLELPVLSSSFKARIFEIRDGRLFSVACTSLNV
jgi:hypothetical protein